MISHSSRLAQSNVTWSSPSLDSSGSMPLGNGDIGLNVWMEASGDLLLLLSKTDAYNENNRLLKLGRVRIALSPALETSTRFEQTLHLESGSIEVRGGDANLKIWVDANAPVVRIEMTSQTPRAMQIDLEIWRDRERVLEGAERASAYDVQDSPTIVETPDLVLESENRLLWCHRNERSMWPQNMKLQKIDDLPSAGNDPLLGRTFGAAILGNGFARQSGTRLVTPASREGVVEIHALTCQTPTLEEWTRQLEAQVAQSQRVSLEAARAAHEDWWREFWNRSYVHVSGTPRAETVSRAHALQRFVTACSGRGQYPIKFNGSIFTFEMPEPGMFVEDAPDAPTYDADYRRWGGSYWFQNTRLIYWPLLASGDYDLLAPWFKMYRDALALALERTPKYFAHGGAYFPETMTAWGTYPNSDYNYARTDPDDIESTNPWTRRYYQGGLELCAMGLELWSHTRDETFARETLLPLAEGVLRFYDEHYPRDERGKLRMEGAQSLETRWDVVNPAPDIAGLQYVLARLLDLPDALVADEQRANWQRLQSELPALPMENGVLAIAEEIFDGIRNEENPELYAIFPYPLFGVGKPELEMARKTFARRVNSQSRGWHQNAIQSARLGLAEEARDMVTENFCTPPKFARFPVFWGPNYDWAPDQCHGTVAMTALQEMILQSDGDKIFVLPAWPREWNVEWKLRAPNNTIVEGVFRDGKTESLNSTPQPSELEVINCQAPQESDAQENRMP